MVACEMIYNITLIKEIYNLSISNTPIRLVKKVICLFLNTQKDKPNLLGQSSRKIYA